VSFTIAGLLGTPLFSAAEPAAKDAGQLKMGLVNIKSQR
jgi:hypothetical protein